MLKMTRKICIDALYGGLFFGGGGGGQLTDGLRFLEEAFAHADALTLLSPAEIREDGILLTAAMVGAPSAPMRCVTETHWLRALEGMENALKTGETSRITGIITNENGAISTTNGWLLSALTGLPLVDLPCNGRAHPTSLMGCMDLDRRSDYQTIQSAAGGSGERNIELVVKGSLEAASSVIRSCSEKAGGLIAVLRNPVSISYARKKNAEGAIASAVRAGAIFTSNYGNVGQICDILEKRMGAVILLRGGVRDFRLETRNGFDVGSFSVGGESGSEIRFWNEYMTIESNRGGVQRIATFPDLIVTLDAKTGIPLGSAEICEGRDVVLLYIPKERLQLGAGMRRRDLLVEAGHVIGKKML